MVLFIKMQRRNKYRRFTTTKEINCSCGGKAKLGSRKNYPFGKKSKPKRTKFYKCKTCGNVMISNNNEKGGR